MKQNDIIIGNKYLFKCTDTLHKKDMIGKIFTIKGIKKGKIKKSYWVNQRTKKPNRYLLCNGRYANAGELKQI